MGESESYIIENADTFDWDNFVCEQTVYSEDFFERFKYYIKFFTLDGKYHSYKDRPAFIVNSGKAWYEDGELHREDGPAAIYSDGSMFWYNNGCLHREDGPAIENDPFANEVWFLDGVESSKDEVMRKYEMKKKWEKK